MEETTHGVEAFYSYEPFNVRPSTFKQIDMLKEIIRNPPVFGPTDKPYLMAALRGKMHDKEGERNGRLSEGMLKIKMETRRLTREAIEQQQELIWKETMMESSSRKAGDGNHHNDTADEGRE